MEPHADGLTGISSANVKTMADHSGRSYGLLFNWEITGDPKVGEILKRYMHIFAQPTALTTSPGSNFPRPSAWVGLIMDSGSSARDGYMFFHNFGAMHALLEYYYLTHDDACVIRSLKWLTMLWPHTKRKNIGGSIKVSALAFAARHAANPAPTDRLWRPWILARRRYRQRGISACVPAGAVQPSPLDRSHGLLA